MRMIKFFEIPLDKTNSNILGYGFSNRSKAEFVFLKVQNFQKQIILYSSKKNRNKIGQKFFLRFLEKLKARWFAFEIFWVLAKCSALTDCKKCSFGHSLDIRRTESHYCITLGTLPALASMFFCPLQLSSTHVNDIC